MKLLLVFILFFLFLIPKLGIGWELKKNMSVVNSFSERQEVVFSRHSVIGVGGWMNAYLMLRDLLAPVKQVDLPQDYPANHFAGKVVYGVDKSSSSDRIQALYSPKFMRLLLARYINGFYIYSLEKLII